MRVTLSLRNNYERVENGRAMPVPFANEPSTDDLLEKFSVMGTPDTCIRHRHGSRAPPRRARPRPRLALHALALARHAGVVAAPPHWRRAVQEEHLIKALSRPQKDALVHDVLPHAQRARHER